MVDAGTASDRPRRGRPPRTAAQRASHREQLVRRSIGVIRHAGSEVSLDELAAGIGVSKPVLYDEFGSRLGVADAVAAALARQLERTVAAQLADPDRTDVDHLIDALTETFITLVDEEAELYEFIVRAFWNDGRGLLGNPLVRLLHERVQPIVAARSAVGDDELTILIDGMYGFMLASVQSWKVEPRLSRDEMVKMIGTVLQAALRGVERSSRPDVSPRS